MSVAERSASRGREAYSTGRGGIGNIRLPSQSRDARSETELSGPDDFSPTRGRELLGNSNHVFSTGRGGVGNIRSPSRDMQKTPIMHGVEEEEEIIREYKKSQEGAPVSSGRGGLGNINRSRSRDPASNLVLHSPSKSGFGHTVSGEGYVTDAKDVYAEHNEKHSITGRGVVSPTHAPAVEHHSHNGDECQSTGRGEQGNKTKKS